MSVLRTVLVALVAWDRTRAGAASAPRSRSPTTCQPQGTGAGDVAIAPSNPGRSASCGGPRPRSICSSAAAAYRGGALVRKAALGRRCAIAAAVPHAPTREAAITVRKSRGRRITSSQSAFPSGHDVRRSACAYAGTNLRSQTGGLAMRRRSAQPPSMASLAVQFAATAVLFFVGWLLVWRAGGDPRRLRRGQLAWRRDPGTEHDDRGPCRQSRDTGNRSTSSPKESKTIGPGAHGPAACRSYRWVSRCLRGAPAVVDGSQPSRGLTGIPCYRGNPG
jgi:hypothetical protein